MSIKYGSSPVMPKKCQLTIATKRLKKHFLNVISIFTELSQPLERVVGLLIKLQFYGHYCFKKVGNHFEKGGADPCTPCVHPRHIV